MQPGVLIRKRREACAAAGTTLFMPLLYPFYLESQAPAGTILLDGSTDASYNCALGKTAGRIRKRNETAFSRPAAHKNAARYAT